MRPYPEEVLRAVQTGIGAHFAPELKSTYATAQFAFSMILFTIALRDYDSAVPDLLESNSALRGLLDDVAVALGRIDGDDARAALKTIGALPEPAPSFRLSALRAEQEALRQALCTLTPLVEPAADFGELAPLRDVRSRIYDWLAADAKKRSVPVLSAG